MPTKTKTNTKTKTSKKNRRLKLLTVLTVLICLLMCSASGLSIVNSLARIKDYSLAQSYAQVSYDNQLAPTQDADGYWCFTTDKDLKIVQITDVHLGGGFLSKTQDAYALATVATILKTEKPDLVIVTGDVAYPVPFSSGTLNNRIGAKMFADFMESLGIYWTLCFGNHDTEFYSYFDRKQISDFYQNGNYHYCLFQPGEQNIDGYGNQVIKVKNSLGLITQNLYIFDSHSYTDGDYLGILWKYDGIHDNQIEWYKTLVAKFNAENEEVLSNLSENEMPENVDDYKNIKSLAFFHIPLFEFETAWTEFAENGYKDTDNVKYRYGMVGETGKCIYHSIHEDEVFETFSSLGSTQGIFCGHDHFNNFSLDYRGITLTYGYSIDCLAYIGIMNKGSQRGATVINIHPDGTFDSQGYNFYSSGRYSLPTGLADNVEMQFEDITYQYFKEN